MPKQKYTGTIALPTPGPYHFGDTIEFDVTTDAPVYWIALLGYVDEEVVFSDTRRQDDSRGLVFTLGGSVAWPSGPADCEASLFVVTQVTPRVRRNELDAVVFHVEA